MSRRRCPECCNPSCSGTACLTLTIACGTASNAGYSVAVTRSDDGSPIGSSVTDSSGHACVTFPPDLSYPLSVDVVASKEGCNSLAWSDQDVPCNGVLDFTGMSSCGSGAIKVTVKGCVNLGVPGATVTLSSAGYSTTTTTDATGVALLSRDGSSNSYTISVSADRFQPRSVGPFGGPSCLGGALTVSMTPKDGYICCGINAYGSGSPWPIPKVLTLNDGGGPLAISACGGVVCAVRSMDNVGSTSNCTAVSFTCPDVGSPDSGRQPPSIGFGSSPSMYTLDLTTTTPSLAQANSVATPSTLFPADTSQCLGLGFDRLYTRAWRCPVDCTTSFWKGFDQTGFTVMSLYPLLIVFHFVYTPRWGPNFGPDATTPPPTSAAAPFAVDVTVGE